MTSLTRRRLATIATVLLLASTTLVARTACAETGDLWETTSQMTMEGIPAVIPSHTSKSCLPKVWTEPPGADQERRCTTSDFTSDGSKVTWKVACPAPNAMTGTGEIVRDGADHYTGVITFTSAEANMTTRLNGKRVGDCELAAK